MPDMTKQAYQDWLDTWVEDVRDVQWDIRACTLHSVSLHTNLFLGDIRGTIREDAVGAIRDPARASIQDSVQASIKARLRYPEVFRHVNN
jgi:hypothetical protein